MLKEIIVTGGLIAGSVFSGYNAYLDSKIEINRKNFDFSNFSEYQEYRRQKNERDYNVLSKSVIAGELAFMSGIYLISKRELKRVGECKENFIYNYE
jgi:hypothetical protein